MAAEASSLVTAVECTCVLVIAVYWCVGAAGGWIADIVGALVVIVAIDRRVCAGPSPQVTRVKGTRVTIITSAAVGALEIARIAHVLGADVSVVAAICVNGLALRIARVDGTRIAVVDALGVVNTIASVLVTKVCCACITIIAVDGGVTATSYGITFICCAFVIIITGKDVLTGTGRWLAGVCGTSVFVVADHGRVSALAIGRIAEVDGAEVIVGACFDFVDAGAGFLLTGVGRAGVSVVAVFGLVLDTRGL